MKQEKLTQKVRKMQEQNMHFMCTEEAFHVKAFVNHVYNLPMFLCDGFNLSTYKLVYHS